MTSLAGIWGQVAEKALVAGKALGKAATATVVGGHSDEFRLRALPKEEIYFRTKAIDNTRVVRLVDQRDRNASLGVASAVPIAASLFIALLLPGGYNLLASRRMEKLQHEREVLLNEMRLVRAEHTGLLSPKQLEQWSAKDYESPKAAAVVFAPPAGDAQARLNGPRR